MNIIATASIAIALILAALYFTRGRTRARHRLLKSFRQRFRQLGLANNLSFSSQEFLENAAIGFDGINRRLVILVGKSDGSCHHHIFYLSEIKRCSVKFVFCAERAGRLEVDQGNHHLRKLLFCFEYKRAKAALELVVYERKLMPVNEIEVLVRKAKQWELMLAKLLTESPGKAA
ncbi:MAG TPA: hypothetical protein VGB56_11195 [Flavisolibacter sp.]